MSVSSLDHAWVHTVAEWTNPLRHDEMFRLVTLHGAWVWVARRYKEYLELHAGDEIAQRQLRRIERGSLLLSMYASAKPEKRRPMPYRATVSMLVMLCIAMGIGSFYTACIPSTMAPPTANDSINQIAVEVIDLDEELIAFSE